MGQPDEGAVIREGAWLHGGKGYQRKKPLMEEGAWLGEKVEQPEEGASDEGSSEAGAWATIGRDRDGGGGGGAAKDCRRAARKRGTAMRDDHHLN